ncbi:hypothetical protein HK104_006260, partial [Borealophlyctis nickersoniae]
MSETDHSFPARLRDPKCKKCVCIAFRGGGQTMPHSSDDFAESPYTPSRDKFRFGTGQRRGVASPANPPKPGYSRFWKETTGRDVEIERKPFASLPQPKRSSTKHKHDADPRSKSPPQPNRLKSPKDAEPSRPKVSAGEVERRRAREEKEQAEKSRRASESQSDAHDMHPLKRQPSVYGVSAAPAPGSRDIDLMAISSDSDMCDADRRRNTPKSRGGDTVSKGKKKKDGAGRAPSVSSLKKGLTLPASASPIPRAKKGSDSGRVTKADGRSDERRGGDAKRKTADECNQPTQLKAADRPQKAVDTNNRSRKDEPKRAAVCEESREDTRRKANSRSEGKKKSHSPTKGSGRRDRVEKSMDCSADKEKQQERILKGRSNGGMADNAGRARNWREMDKAADMRNSKKTPPKGQPEEERSRKKPRVRDRTTSPELVSEKVGKSQSHASGNEPLADVRTPKDCHGKRDTWPNSLASGSPVRKRKRTSFDFRISPVICKSLDNCKSVDGCNSLDDCSSPDIPNEREPRLNFLDSIDFPLRSGDNGNKLQPRKPRASISYLSDSDDDDVNPLLSPVPRNQDTVTCPSCMWPLPTPLSAKLQSALINLQRPQTPPPSSPSSPPPISSSQSDPIALFEFCRLHTAEENTIPAGIKKGYPMEIDFAGLKKRVMALKRDMMDIATGKVRSPYRDLALAGYRSVGVRKAQALPMVCDILTTDLSVVFGFMQGRNIRLPRLGEYIAGIMER